MIDLTAQLINTCKKRNLLNSYWIDSINKKILDKILSKRILPKNKKRHVGVEIEIDSPSSRFSISKDIFKVGLIDKVSLGEDSSIYSWLRNNNYEEEHGYEIRVIDTEKNISKTLKKVCKILKKHKAETNLECGLHVHIDCRNRNRTLVFDNFLKAQKLLYKIVSPDRANGDYSMARNISNTDTYSSHEYGVECSIFDTVEIRMHQGTINFNDINNWITLLLKIANKTTSYKRYTTHKSIINLTSFKDDTKKYINKNIALYQTEKENTYGYNDLFNY